MCMWFWTQPNLWKLANYFPYTRNQYDVTDSIYRRQSNFLSRGDFVQHWWWCLLDQISHSVYPLKNNNGFSINTVICVPLTVSFLTLCYICYSSHGCSIIYEYNNILRALLVNWPSWHVVLFWCHIKFTTETVKWHIVVDGRTTR